MVGDGEAKQVTYFYQENLKKHKGRRGEGERRERGRVVCVSSVCLLLYPGSNTVKLTSQWKLQQNYALTGTPKPQISKRNQKKKKQNTPTKRMIEYIHISQYKSGFWSDVCVRWQGIKSTKCTKRSHLIASSHTRTHAHTP